MRLGPWCWRTVLRDATNPWAVSVPVRPRRLPPSFTLRFRTTPSCPSHHRHRLQRDPVLRHRCFDMPRTRVWVGIIPTDFIFCKVSRMASNVQGRVDQITPLGLFIALLVCMSPRLLRATQDIVFSSSMVLSEARAFACRVQCSHISRIGSSTYFAQYRFTPLQHGRFVCWHLEFLSTFLSRDLLKRAQSRSRSPLQLTPSTSRSLASHRRHASFPSRSPGTTPSRRRCGRRPRPPCVCLPLLHPQIASPPGRRSRCFGRLGLFHGSHVHSGASLFVPRRRVLRQAERVDLRDGSPLRPDEDLRRVE